MVKNPAGGLFSTGGPRRASKAEMRDWLDFDMRPRLSPPNHARRSAPYLEHPSQNRKRLRAGFDVTDLPFKQLGISVSFATRYAVPVPGVGPVLSLCAVPQMRWINARPIVA